MAELILSCGLEGGGFDLYTLTENDVTLFYVSGSAMYLDENDDEAWRSWESEKVAGWENALQLLQQHQWWITIPTYIHLRIVRMFWQPFLRKKISDQPLFVNDGCNTVNPKQINNPTACGKNFLACVWKFAANRQRRRTI